MTGRKEKVSQPQQQGSHTHKENAPERPHTGKQRTLHFGSLQDLFFIRPHLPRPEDRADFPSTQTQMQRVGRKKGLDEYGPK